MKTFTEMAEEWIRANMPTVDAPARLQATDFDLLDLLWEPFVDWFNVSIWLDVEWITRCRPGPRWCAGLSVLHSTFCDWMIAKDQVPPTVAEFRLLLQKLGCAIRAVGNVQLVLGIALKEDVDGLGNFNRGNGSENAGLR